MQNFSYKAEDLIIYEDQDVIVCHKPYGLAVQNARLGAMDLESLLKNYLAVKSAPEIPYLAVIHRLDQPVEGLLVFAKTPKVARELSRQMSEGKMGKKYLAVTGNMPKEIQGRLVDYLKRDGRKNISSVVKEGTQGSKRASLSYQLLQEKEENSEKKYLLEICLETGRHHQIRVQMAHAGMPLLGDQKYNSEEKKKVPLGLCSWKLDFNHPGTGKEMHFQISPKGEAFRIFSVLEE